MTKEISPYLRDMVFCAISFLATRGIVGGFCSYEDMMQNCLSKLHDTSDSLKKEQNKNDMDNTDQCNESSKPPKQEQSSASFPSIEEVLKDVGDLNSADKSSKLAADLDLMLKLNQDLNEKIDELTLFEKAIQDIKDSSIPIKGHGLIAIGKLLSNRDKEALLHKKELLAIFQVCWETIYIVL